MWHYLSYHVSCMYQGSSLMDARHRTLMHTICTKTVTESHIFEQLKKPTYGCILKMPPITFICTPMCLLSPIGKNEFILLIWKIKKKRCFMVTESQAARQYIFIFCTLKNLTKYTVMLHFTLLMPFLCLKDEK